jgi:hypothetical protein
VKSRRRFRFYLLASALLVCLVASAVSVNQQLRRDRLDHALIPAVKALDVPGVERLPATRMLCGEVR